MEKKRLYGPEAFVLFTLLFAIHRRESNMRSLAIAAALMTLTLAGSALAFASPAAVDGAHSTVPEPGAAVLFAVGIGISAWSIRRNNKRS